MKLEISHASRRHKLLPAHVVDYAMFKESFANIRGENELHLLEKFYAARDLTSGFPETYVDATITDSPRKQHSFTVDVAGVDDEELTLVFCEVAPPDEQLIQNLKLIEQADNSTARFIYPFRVSADALTEHFPESFESGRFSIERVSWKSGEIERSFRYALSIMDLLTNETRVRMLLPLLERPTAKREFREAINPKLVYENVSNLMTHKIIDQLEEDTYDLTPLGRRILCEYLAFVEKVRRDLEEFDKD